MKKILIGIASGIAAYKIIDLIKILKKENVEIDVIATTAASQMIDKSEIEKMLGKKIHTDLFPKGFNYHKVLKKREVDHVRLADSADLVVIAPATANVIAKMAHGIADDFLTTTLLATTASILICPSMNVHMWEHPATQENLQTLATRGVHILHPESGALACGYTGVGRLPTTEKIKNEIIHLLHQRHPGLARLAKQDPGSIYIDPPKAADDKNRWFGKKVLITAGGTSIPIDSVRMITNRASGKMGKALAQVSLSHGAQVVLLRANNAVAAQSDIQQELFETPDELYTLIQKHAKNADIIFHTAAVSDFAPKEKLRGKIDSNKSYTLILVPQRKIIDALKKINPKIFVVAFKAVVEMTDKGMIAVAEKKLQQKTIDAVVVNDVGKPDRGFMVDTNEVIVVQKNKKPTKIKLAHKQEIAQRIFAILQF